VKLFVFWFAWLRDDNCAAVQSLWQESLLFFKLILQIYTQKCLKLRITLEVRFEVLTVVLMRNPFLCVITCCSSS
jgi:hypothetical protein